VRETTIFCGTQILYIYIYTFYKLYIYFVYLYIYIYTFLEKKDNFFNEPVELRHSTEQRSSQFLSTSRWNAEITKLPIVCIAECLSVLNEYHVTVVHWWEIAADCIVYC